MKTRRQVLLAVSGVALAGCSLPEDGGDGYAGVDGGDDGGDASDGGEADASDGGYGGSDGDAGAQQTDTETDDGGTADGSTDAGLSLTSPAFEHGETIPVRYTGEGADLSPPLTIEGVPDEAGSLALVVDDPDAPGGDFVHWLLWNVPADVTEIPEGVPQQETVPSLDGASQGTNDFDELGYRGPLPPEGDGPHRYRFTLYALDGMLDLEAGAKRDSLGNAMDGRIRSTARVTGMYER